MLSSLLRQHKYQLNGPRRCRIEKHLATHPTQVMRRPNLQLGVEILSLVCMRNSMFEVSVLSSSSFQQLFKRALFDDIFLSCCWLERMTTATNDAATFGFLLGGPFSFNDVTLGGSPGLPPVYIVHISTLFGVTVPRRPNGRILFSLNYPSHSSFIFPEGKRPSVFGGGNRAHFFQPS